MKSRVQTAKKKNNSQNKIKSNHIQATEQYLILKFNYLMILNWKSKKIYWRIESHKAITNSYQPGLFRTRKLKPCSPKRKRKEEIDAHVIRLCGICWYKQKRIKLPKVQRQLPNQNVKYYLFLT